MTHVLVFVSCRSQGPWKTGAPRCVNRCRRVALLPVTSMLSTTTSPPTARSWDVVCPTPDVTFFAVGDFGKPCDDLRSVARSMDDYARTVAAPALVLCLGDNFYPCMLHAL